MGIDQILILAVVQGLTEFLPISSSGHLILSPYLFGFADQGLSLDVAVHLGSLFAVMAYFRQDIASIIVGWTQSVLPGGQSNEESRLGWAIIIGTLPVVIVGLLIKEIVESHFRAPWVIGAATVIFGLLLWWADVSARRQRDTRSISLRDALIIGAAQILALIPGTSRSGITMTAGLMIGLTREAASRFSFLLAIPTILASSLLVTLDLIEQPQTPDWNGLLIGVVASAIAAYLCIHLFLKFIERIGMLPFVIYRMALGALIFYLIW